MSISCCGCPLPGVLGVPRRDQHQHRRQALGVLGQSGPEVPVRRAEGVQREEAGRCGEERRQAVDTSHFHRGQLQRHRRLPSAQDPAGLPARLGEDKTEACGNLP
jgi:hypothetical protein